MKSVLIYSGGMDSTTLLYKLLSEGKEVVCLGMDYGQRHKKELEAAKAICQKLNLPYEIVDLTSLTKFLAGSSQTSPEIEVPEGHYSDETMKKTVVPNRNMIMLAVAAGHAISIKADEVAYAAHSGDHAIYPDCRKEFALSVNLSFGLCDWHKINLYAPFLSLSKSDIVRVGTALEVPYKDTWSCYKGKEQHCGKCGTCVERIEAFQLASVQDPTAYEA